jgi:cysteine desulfurase
MPRIYLDYNATTPLDPDVLEDVCNVLKNISGNPSSLYEEGRTARILIEDSRQFIKLFLDANSEDELIFTSSGTESINLAIVGYINRLMSADKGRKLHIITTAVEHHAVLNTFQFLETQGIETTYIGINNFGELLIDDLLSSIKENTVLISIMGANNETGTIFPLKNIINEIKKINENIAVHSDVVQVIGKHYFSIKDTPLDMCSFSGHKFYAMKGNGVLYIKKGIKIDPIIHGGHQERGYRGGTENTAGIVSIAKALEIVKNSAEENLKKINFLGSMFLDKLFSAVDNVRLNGHPVNRLKNTINISIDGIKAETLLFNLDLYGISASAGSACNAGALVKSHVLEAHGYDAARVQSAIRFSIGRWTTEDDIEYAVNAVKKSVLKLRSLQ